VSAAGPLLLTPRLRPRPGPALRPAPLPVTATLLSAITHGALAAIVIVGAHVFARVQPKTYIVNLVPAVAAVGAPQGRPALPPRAEEPPPRVTRRNPSELPERETPRAAPPAPKPPPDLPARSPSLPELPARTPALPERATPPRPSAAPRAGDKELPPIASTATPPAPAPTPPAPAPSVTSRAEPPASALGRPSGSAQGSGPMTLNVSDFPFTWYLTRVQQKVTERWEGRALQGRQPVVTFEIARDGQVSNVAIKDSSGNRYYDLTAMRAIADAAPFPPLPGEFPGSVLRIHLGFNFAQDRG
jgi:TonB family protein